MPDGLLLLAFALTLVANAALIAVAIRAMRPGGSLEDPGAAGATPAPAPTPTPARPRPASVPAPDIPSPAPPASVPANPEPTGPAAAAPTSAAAPERRPARAARRKAAVATAPSAGSAGTTRPRSGTGRRRRFSLPPLDEDHEKVSRSIESFLSGGDAGAEPSPGPVSSDRDAAPEPTTVALVSVSGDALSEPTHVDGRPHADVRDRSGRGEEADSSPEEIAVAAVERSLRSAARGTDHVQALGPGRYRVVLAATGELAARAYLRRVRATVEPLLEELDPPRRLAVATATVLGDPLVRADEVARRRLASILETDGRDRRRRDADEAGEPRAAGD